MATHLEQITHTHADSHGHHVTPVKVFLMVYSALMVLLFITVGAAFVDLTTISPVHVPGLNIIVMLLIAIVKAVLVVLYFMEVKKGSRLVWLWAAIGFIWFITMFVTLGDYLTRAWGVRGW